MFWLSWRQSRLELLIGGGALALVAVFLLWTGLDMSSAYDKAGLPACEETSVNDDWCFNTAGDFLDKYRKLDGLTGWLNLLPLLLGLLLAAPTILDLEQGTYRLAWTQSVTRRRWMATKMGFALAIAAGTAVVLTAMMTWWRQPFDAIDGRLNGNAFDFEGIVPIAYLVFAFALCLSLGAFLRRTVPAVGIALVLFLVARLGVVDQLRPNYLSPLKATWDPLEPAPPVDMRWFFGDGNWIIRQGFVDVSGRELSSSGPIQAGSALDACMRAANAKSGEAVDRCLHDNGFMQSIVYHPAGRFWTFQAIETALFLGVAAVLLGLTFWWVTRRIV
jgi:hypothetical protein